MPLALQRYVYVAESRADALDAVLAGKPVKSPQVSVKGCALQASAKRARPGNKISYANQIAPMLAVARKVVEDKIPLPIDCHLLITISEEVGSGASSILHGDIAEMLTIDTGPIAPGQSTHEYGVTVCMADSNGPFDYHLTHHLIRLCRENGIEHHRDLFKYYKCDSASAIEAGNDIRTALVCFGTDATHGYERCHEKTLMALGHLLLQYVASDPLFERDRKELGDLKGFPTLPVDE